MRKLVVILAFGLLAACSGQGLPLDVTDGGDGDMTCGKAGTVCCGEESGNSTTYWCDPGLYCKTHRGGPAALCFPVQDGGAP